MMKIRPISGTEDWLQVVELSNKGNFPLPVFRNIVAAWVVEQDNKIIAFGCGEKLIEALFIPDVYESKRTIVEALKLLVKAAIESCKENKIETLHSFTEDDDFTQILLKHFDFRLRNQQPLQLELNLNGEESASRSS